METQLYRKTNLSSSTEIELHDTTYQELAGALGFQHVAKFTEASRRVDDASLFYPELKGAELVTWERFLPTAVNIGSYMYDQPPMEALQAIADAKAMNFFDSIVIWTPKDSDAAAQVAQKYRVASKNAATFVASLDPMALGVVYHNGTSRYFPIARWGESLKSYQSVKRSNAAVRARILLMMVVIPMIIVAVVLGMIVAAMQAHGWDAAPRIIASIGGSIGAILLTAWALDTA